MNKISYQSSNAHIVLKVLSNGNNMHILKAAGTPIIKDFPLATCSAKLTLLPGESSTKISSFGMLSPTLMKARTVL